MIVLDSSAAVAMFIGGASEQIVGRLARDPDLHAPHLIDIEVLHTLRRMVAQRVITVDVAARYRFDFADLRITRYPHEPLADRIWELRADLSAYDAAFVALAEQLDAPLLTCDARLARAPGHDASIELFATP